MPRGGGATKLDKIDRLILQELTKNARISNIELSRKVNLSATPCLMRVRRLEREGFIQGYSADLDYDRLGLPLLVFVQISVSQSMIGRLKHFKAQLRELPEVLECYMVSGDVDYLLKVRVADMQHFHAFLTKGLSSLPQIRQTHSYFVVEKLKSTDELQLPADGD